MYTWAIPVGITDGGGRLLGMPSGEKVTADQAGQRAGAICDEKHK
jgi:hypothetical protein